MPQRELPIPSVGALLIAPDETLLLVKTHKWKNRYGLPGGKIEIGETLEAALAREIHEETGLQVRNPQFLCIQESIHAAEFYKSKHMLLINYVGRVEAKEVRLNDEAEAYVWVTAEKSLEMDLNQPTRKLIELYLETKT